MDVLPRITRQLFELLRAMSLVQRAIIFVVSLSLLGGLTWMAYESERNRFEFVSAGRTFEADEMDAAESALRQAGLTGHRRDGKRLRAPAHQLALYDSTVSRVQVAPSDLGSQMMKKFESLGPFTTDRQRQEVKDALLLTELRRMIKEVPDIEDARVAIANPARRASFGQKSRVTANITIKTKPGRDLLIRQVTSLRQAVASMVPDLKAEDITVFDVSTGHAFSGELADDFSDGNLHLRVRELTRQYQDQIQKALSFVPDAKVEVIVDIDQLKSSIARAEKRRREEDSRSLANRPAAIRGGELAENPTAHRTGFRGPGETTVFRQSSESVLDLEQMNEAFPNAMRVHVVVPREHLNGSQIRRKAQGESAQNSAIREERDAELVARVERTVRRVIPTGSPKEAISVSTVDRAANARASDVTLFDMEQIVSNTKENWVTVLLSGLALIVVWKLTRIGRRSSQIVVENETQGLFDGATTQLHSGESTQTVVENRSAIQESVDLESVPLTVPPAMTRLVIEASQTRSAICDEVRSLVQSDPVVTAAVLGRWLSEAA